MEPRTKSSLLWGAVGALAFLALVQGYQLVTEATVTADAMALVAVVVGLGATVAAYWLEGRLGPAGARPPEDPGGKEQS